MHKGLTVEELIDLSLPVKSLDAIVAPLFPQPLRTAFTTFEEAGFRSNVWTLVEHVGTHVDAPNHILQEGPPVDQTQPSRYVGRGCVLDFSHVPPGYVIGEDDLRRALRGRSKDVRLGPGWILLLYTGYTAKARSPDWPRHPGLSEAAARFLAGTRVNGIGIDAPSPDVEPDTGVCLLAHKILLSSQLTIFENLTNLDKLIGKEFIFVGCPLFLVGGSGSPVRAVGLILGS